MDRRKKLYRAVRQAHGGHRFVAALVGFIFAGIGVTVIAFLWGAPFGEFGSPPIFFRIVGSFIALAFVGVGGSTGVAALAGRGLSSPLDRSDVVDDEDGGREESSAGEVSPAQGGYRCPRCGAPLGRQADVSPSGDAKCAYCRAWFNIHNA
jgi:DNA-directed RNA polymerase subunit RPC12/RpoP